MYWTAGQRITGERLENFLQRGIQLISFTNQTSWTVAVVFPVPFAAVPEVFTNINSGASATARWGSRAIGISSTGFNLFLFAGDSGAPSVSWTDVPVQWAAVAP